MVLFELVLKRVHFLVLIKNGTLRMWIKGLNDISFINLVFSLDRRRSQTPGDES